MVVWKLDNHLKKNETHKDTKINSKCVKDLDVLKIWDRKHETQAESKETESGS